MSLSKVIQRQNYNTHCQIHSLHHILNDSYSEYNFQANQIFHKDDALCDGAKFMLGYFELIQNYHSCVVQGYNIELRS